MVAPPLGSEPCSSHLPRGGRSREQFGWVHVRCSTLGLVAQVSGTPPDWINSSFSLVKERCCSRLKTVVRLSAFSGTQTSVWQMFSGRQFHMFFLSTEGRSHLRLFRLDERFPTFVKLVSKANFSTPPKGRGSPIYLQSLSQLWM